MWHVAQTDPFADAAEYDYEIYSKIWDERGKATLRASANAAKCVRAACCVSLLRCAERQRVAAARLQNMLQST
jgi:hypothetical protein